MHSRSGGAASSRLIQAQPPHISQRTGVRSRSCGCRLRSENDFRARHERVRAVGPVAPTVEGADEAGLACSPSLGHLDAAVPAGVLEGADAKVGRAHDDDRLVQEFVFDEVVRLGDLLEPAGHLPDAGPQQVDLHLEEVGVVVPLLGGTVGKFHGEGHGECRPFPIHECHAILSSRAFACPDSHTDRANRSWPTDRGHADDSRAVVCMPCGLLLLGPTPPRSGSCADRPRSCGPGGCRPLR